MGATTSLFLDLLNAQSVDLIVTERKQELHFRLLTAVAEGKEAVEILASYRFKLNLHIQVENRHNAPYSTGCGCEYCVARHQYAKLRLQLHRRVKHFDSSLLYDRRGELSEHDLAFKDIHEREKMEFLERIDLARARVVNVKERLVKIGMPVY